MTKHRRKDSAKGSKPGAEEEPNGSFQLTERERDEVEENLPPRVQVLHEAIRVEGTTELGRSIAALSWSSLAAG
ncbi:MAG: formate/nitrite transporter family protein, partial [Rhodanobacteraceae bacterium]